MPASKFRRQHVIAPYIVDFACIERWLIIEADGGQHADSKSDPRRDAYLAALGFRVLRFWNNDVLENARGCLRAIARGFAHPSPSHSCGVGPSLSPEGRGANGASNA